MVDPDLDGHKRYDVSRLKRGRLQAALFIHVAAALFPSSPYMTGKTMQQAILMLPGEIRREKF
jgi:hypothetical protein